MDVPERWQVTEIDDLSVAELRADSCRFVRCVPLKDQVLPIHQFVGDFQKRIHQRLRFGVRLSAAVFAAVNRSIGCGSDTEESPLKVVATECCLSMTTKRPAGDNQRAFFM